MFKQQEQNFYLIQLGDCFNENSLVKQKTED